MNIIITTHVIDRYIERFAANLASIEPEKARIAAARKAILSIVQSAHYVSDDERGVLLRSDMHQCNLIVRNRALVTLYYPSKKIRAREHKHGDKNGSKHGRADRRSVPHDAPRRE